MGRINQKKLNYYVKKLYQGELKRFKEREEADPFLTPLLLFEEERKKRVRISQSQKAEVVRKYNYKCAICGEKYTVAGFHFHHIDGDPSHTVVSNIVLLCARCHDLLHRRVKAKLQDYKVKRKRAKKEAGLKLELFSSPKLDFGSTDLFSPFGTSKKKRTSKKKTSKPSKKRKKSSSSKKSKKSGKNKRKK